MSSRNVRLNAFDACKNVDNRNNPSLRQSVRQ